MYTYHVWSVLVLDYFPSFGIYNKDSTCHYNQPVGWPEGNVIREKAVTPPHAQHLMAVCQKTCTIWKSWHQISHNCQCSKNHLSMVESTCFKSWATLWRSLCWFSHVLLGWSVTTCASVIISVKDAFKQLADPLPRLCTLMYTLIPFTLKVKREKWISMKKDNSHQYRCCH